MCNSMLSRCLRSHIVRFICLLCFFHIHVFCWTKSSVEMDLTGERTTGVRHFLCDHHRGCCSLHSPFTHHQRQHTHRLHACRQKHRRKNKLDRAARVSVGCEGMYILKCFGRLEKKRIRTINIYRTGRLASDSIDYHRTDGSTAQISLLEISNLLLSRHLCSVLAGLLNLCAK